MTDILISRPVHSVDDGCCIASSNIKIDGQDLEFKHKVSHGPVSNTADAFLAAGLIPAMKVEGDLRIKGSVSPKLLRATATIQDIVTSWFPAYSSISIEAETLNNAESTDQRGVGSFFSGGMDAFYTLLKHRDEITTIIFIHGFDIPLYNNTLRERASKSVKEVATEFGKVLIEIETNLPECLAKVSSWFTPAGGFAHGAVMASIALLLSPQLKKVYVPSSNTYNDLSPWGSHPILDPLWSTEDVEIVHDGCEATRVKKAALIAQSEIALKNLRVCLKPEDALNCGQCEKCLRCMANLRAVGALEHCNTFRHKLDLEALTQIEKFTAPGLSQYKATLQAVKLNGNDPELAKALHELIKYNESANKFMGEMVPFLKSSTGERLLRKRREAIFEYLWKANHGWMTKEVLKENLKLGDRKLFGGMINKLRRIHR
jgi:hypothetical protein